MDPSLYLFDGSNLFHAGTFRDRDELTDLLASFDARLARGETDGGSDQPRADDRQPGDHSREITRSSCRAARRARGHTRELPNSETQTGSFVHLLNN